mgnify:CR=1 FL=1
MWPLKKRVDADLSRDPAPSRASYRLTRLWLSPLFRRVVTTVMPASVVVALASIWLMQAEQQRLISRWSDEIMGSIEARPEFQIRQMAITGASPALADAVRKRLDLTFPVSWFDLDPDAIHASVAALDAVANAQVTVELGSTMRIGIEQREPALILRTRAGLFLLDATGHRIATIDRRDGKPELPLVTGIGADRAASEALAIFAAARPIEERVRGLTRRGERRWDVVLDKEQIIMLPEGEPLPALERTLAMHSALELLDRDIGVVDMRNPERPVLRLRATAVDNLRVTKAFEQGLKSQ